MLIAKPSHKRLRVLFVLPPFLPTPPPGYGGIEAVAAALLPALEDAGARLTVTTPTGSQLDVSEMHTLTEPLFPLLTNAFNAVEPKVALYISKVLNLAWRGHFDLIHDYTGMVTVASALAGALRGAAFPPVVHTIHGSFPPFANHYLELVKAPRFTITAISRAQLRTAPMRVRQHSHIVPNCLDPRAYPLGPGGDRLLVMGRFDPQKGQDQLIRYCAEHQIPLDVAGPVAEMTDYDQIMTEATKGSASQFWDKPTFRLFVETLPFIDGHLIRYHGNASGAHKLQLLQHARAMVMPNRWEEPFGMAAIEAMASGTPVLGCGGGALPEIIQSGQTGFLTDTFEQLTP